MIDAKRAHTYVVSLHSWDPTTLTQASRGEKTYRIIGWALGPGKCSMTKIHEIFAGVSVE